MTWSDDEEEFGCHNVYLCNRCDDSKPRKDFYKSWDASKMEEVYYKTCKDCREKRRISAKIRYDKNKDKINEKKRDERAKQSQFCEGCNQNVRHENWDEHFFWVRHSGSELNLLLKDFNKNFFNSSKTNEERDAIRQEYHRKKKEIYQKLQEQFPNSKKWTIDE